MKIRRFLNVGLIGEVMITGFIARNWKHNFLPSEEAFSYTDYGKKKSMAVADGVTRDFIDGTPVTNNLSSLIKILLFFYPSPSPASEAAKIFCDVNIIFPYENEGNFCARTVMGCFKYSNDVIKSLNNRRFSSIDYLKNDFAACVGSNALIQGRDIFYGFICDSGISFFSRNGDLRLKMQLEGPNSKGSIDEDIARKFNTNFKYSKGRRIIRSQYRNNPSNSLSYGALTGEDEALHFVRVGYRELKDDELLMLHTDGLESMLELGEFIDNLRQGAEKKDFSNLRRFCRRNVRTEGTALIYLPE